MIIALCILSAVLILELVIALWIIVRQRIFIDEILEKIIKIIDMKNVNEAEEEEDPADWWKKKKEEKTKNG